MISDRSYRVVVVMGVLGIWLLVLQSAGIIPSFRPQQVAGEVEVNSTVEVEGTVDVESVPDVINVNLASVADRDIPRSHHNGGRRRSHPPTEGVR